MSGARGQKRWIVRDAEGRIYGPFTTEQVLEQIDRNYFLGRESIASYPGGGWSPLSTAPEFCDRLLDVLAAEAKSEQPTPQQQPQPTDAKDPAKSGQTGGQRSTRTGSKTSETRTGNTAERIQVTNPISPIDQEENDGETKTSQPASAIIELTDLKAFERIQRLKVSRIPLSIIAGGVVLAIAIVMFSSGKLGGGSRVRLLKPKRNQPELSESKIKSKFARARAAFETDTFDGYQRAENELVEIIEGASKRPEDALKKADYLSFLCLTYREIWPFAYQDSKDLTAVSEIMQEAKRIDPGGLHGSLCELVQLMLNGHVRDAQGLSESVMLEKSQAPVLYEIRGDLYASAKDPTNAVSYFNQARSLWPSWQKSAVEEARAHADLQQFKEAIDLYRAVLRVVPNHGIAKVELGLLEALQFNQYDKGLDLINSGVDERIPRPIAARGYLGVANIYLKRQQKARALDAAKEAYKLDPANKDAKDLLGILGGDVKIKQGETDLMFLGEQYVRSGDYFSAQAQFKAAFDANPKNGIAAMKAGKCLWLLNQTTDAIEWMRKAIRADRQLISAYVELADYYAHRFDYFEAVETLKQAQSLQPKSFEVYRGFANVELLRNDYQGAIDYGQRALKLYDTDMDTLLIMAKAHLGLQQYTEAQKFAARAIDLDYNSIEAHSLYARIETGLHGVDSGAGYIQQMLNRYVITQGQQVPPAAIDLRITLGEIYLQDERDKAAEDVFRQALALDRNSKRAMIGLGRVLKRENQMSEALEQFLKAAVLDPSDAEPIYLSGQLYADSGKTAEAIQQFERVLKINPRYPRGHEALGRVALRRGDPQKALDESMQERAINPDLADAYSLAAEAYFAQKQYSNCAAEYQKAVSKHAGGALILVRMARCYRLTGALDSAQSLLREATAIESGNPDIYKEQGAIFHTKGMPDEAIGAYDTYLRLAPNATDRAEVEARIRKVHAGDLSPGE